MYIKNMIKNELEKDKSLATKLASIGGFKNATPLYKFLNDPVREMDNLGCLVKMLEYLYGNNINSILNEYFATITPNGKLARQALEYASFNAMSVRSELISKMRDCNNAESREWASIYLLLSNLYKSPLEKLKDVNVLNVKTDEMKALKTLMQFYCHYYMDNIHMVEIIALTVEDEIERIRNNDFIKKYFLIRFYKAMAIMYHHKNKLVESRKYADKSIAINDNTYSLATTYQIKGMTYLYEDFDKGDDFLLKSYDYYQMSPNRYDGGIRSSLNLHRAYWNKPIFDLRPDGEVFDKHDAIFYYVKNNDKLTAEKILKTIIEKNLSDRDMAFQHYSKGIVYDKIQSHYDSIRFFKKMGDKFYINLPVMELKKLNINKDILDLVLL